MHLLNESYTTVTDLAKFLGQSTLRRELQVTTRVNIESPPKPLSTYVVSPEHCDVIGEQLQRYDRQDTLQAIDCLGHFNAPLA